MSILKVVARVLLPGVLVLAQADTTSASDRNEQPRLAPPDGWVPDVGVDDVRAGVPGRGDAASGHHATTTTSARNDCPTVLDAGVLPAAGGVLSGDTYLAGDDFDRRLYYGCGDHYGPSGHDEIWEFQVEADGRWTFDTCTIPAGWNTILGIRSDIGIGCPGVGLICNGDDDCGSYGESAIRDVCLQAGLTYWLIVDGWSPATGFPGAPYDVTYSRTVDPCTSDVDCQDRTLCNGIETCHHGCCERGTPPCPPWAECAIECYNVQDPCTAVLKAHNSGYTATRHADCMSWVCDDIETWEGSGDKLLSYKWFFQARDFWDDANVLGADINVESVLFRTSTDGSCLPDINGMIDGTFCQYTGTVTAHGDPPQEMLCEPAGGIQTGAVLPDRSGDTANCEIDFFVCVRSEVVSGAMLTADGGWPGDIVGDGIADEIVGGPAAQDDFGLDMLVYEDCPPTGTFSYVWFRSSGPDPPEDFAELHVCVEPAGVCCFDAGGCDVVAEKDCTGNYQGDNVLDRIRRCEYGDPDDDGFYFDCDNCPDITNHWQRDCDGDGVGDVCEASPDERDDDSDGACNGIDPCPMDPQKFDPGTGLGQAPGQCGCGTLDDDIDRDGTADCIDECPNDPGRIVAGVCGCNRPLEEYEDDDNDGFLNCIDTCPDVDDGVFGPCDPDAIPTLSTWGLLALALTLLAVGKVYFGRRRSADHA